ncbi:alkylated DNA repair protein (DNA oxidative demethylase) [Amycolatopsis xylanica]|uniref:Alkylated DNA repair protein (DNA oxidative demethylase) n=1 Tax=Amycolatopsis xylanica TaxID=589385 RepID=A0A1H2Y4H0_9PSEU|nr:alpha-ketoglutarate-dependent dioxygenase AlkB [Amycolatopsis xylanica]SDX00027.1 alkylated DNA repair protein (DNA oxidative demethylase) [Amycolatopsis xylanica]
MDLIPRPRAEVAPGAVHVPDWLDLETRRRLVAACREWATPRAGFRAARLPNGGVMSVRTVCLGWHWYPYKYSKTIDDVDGAPVTPFPGWLAELGQRAVSDAYGAAVEYQPDIALINHYDSAAKMGLHQDKDEASLEPVVSLSLGDACVFRFGNTEHRGRPWTDVELRSGDLFVFGGPSRLAFHGVTKTLPDHGDPDLDLSGRLNITLRVSGF